MKLVEALEALNESPRPESPVLEVHLACGFTPLHFFDIPKRLLGEPADFKPGTLAMGSSVRRSGFLTPPQIILWRPQENSAQPCKPGEERNEYI